MSANLSESNTMLHAVLAEHRMNIRTQCGAISLPVVHHHGAESDFRPGPKRSLRCTEQVGHEGSHRDAICCYRFQTFEDWQVVDRKPMTFDGCTSEGCHSFWPCKTIRTLQEAINDERV